MIDNGLLKYYKTHSDKSGFLKAYMIAKQVERVKQFNFLRKLSIDENSPDYYLKYFSGTIGVEGLTQEIHDKIAVEVLLSQILASVGLNCAIYYPAVYENGELGVISNDISTENTKSMEDYCLQMQSSGLSFVSPYEESCITPGLVGFKNFMTKEAMKDFVKGYLFFCASGNYDGNPTNVLVDTQKRENELDLITNVKFIDFGNNIFRFDPKYEPVIEYHSGLGRGGLKNKEDFIYDLKVNSFVQSTYSCNEMAEMLGQVNVQNTADNIKEEIEFEVPQPMVDRISKNFDNVANELIV